MAKAEGTPAAKGATEIVAVDIGGTHARFAIATIGADGSITLGEPATLHTKDHGSFQLAWQAFRKMQGGTLPDAVAMSVAGPVDDEVIRFTNNPWILRPARIQEMLGPTRQTIVNDFAAVAYAVACAGEDQFIHLTGPADTPLPATGTITVIGPGTGLGVAHLWRDNGSYRVHATEGGHVDYAPLDLIEDSILARLRSRHTRVSAERVVSGPAIVDIYATLAAMENKPIREQTDVQIWTNGLAGTDPLAAAAVDRFCLALGAVAGDCALSQGASGVVIAGGLGYRMRETLVRSGFRERFTAKGRFGSMMARLPVKLITHPQPGLFGAAAAFAREHLSS
ncbi:glucokinase [Novosphingobium sp. 9]|uniref:glucokinase n=1 Tax=Novosphingobium sp. 9 TaxID=2025349 RepID=UPI0021B547DE|nr:glucokinase [Novosphingobium sp. 9]